MNKRAFLSAIVGLFCLQPLFASKSEPAPGWQGIQNSSNGMTETVQRFTENQLSHDAKDGDVLHYSYGAQNFEHLQENLRFEFLIEAFLPGQSAPIILGRHLLMPNLKATDAGWHRKKISLGRFAGSPIKVKFTVKTSPPQKDSLSFFGAVRIGNFTRRYNQQNVIVISLDTLRGDRLGIAGYKKRPTTPNIDRLAKEGVYFRETISQAPWTKPSHMSLFTSLYPSFHGVRSPPPWLDILPDHETTLAEVYQKEGYLTEAFTGSGMVSARFGFFQGFDHYAERRLKHDDPRDVSFQEAMKWVENNSDDRFFLFIHTYQIHAPYRHDIFAQMLPPGSSKEDKLNAKYDSGVAYVDNHVGELARKLDELGLLDETLIVITSDHGDEILERGYKGKHSHSLYDEVIHIPLMFRAPKMFKPRLVNDFQARSIDVMPTLLDLSGISPPELKLQGISLAGILRGEKLPKESYALSESPGMSPDRKSIRWMKGNQKLKFILAPEISPDTIEMSSKFPRAAWWEDRKRVRPTRMTRYVEEWNGREYYDLSKDPQEKKNLSVIKFNESKQLEKKIVDYMTLVLEQKRQGLTTQQIGEGDLLEMLRSLGY